jgi:Na+/melibiose symporter-like transporter
MADDSATMPSSAQTSLRSKATGRAIGGSMVALGFLFGLLYFVQGIVEPTEGLLAQPTRSLLKHWEHSAASAAWFAFALSLPWAIKPLYGLLTDFVPLAGSRRRSYLLLTTAAAFVGMTAVYVLPLSSDKATLLLILLLLPAVAIAFSDVVIDALMVEVGQPRGMTGRLQSIQWASLYTATIMTGVVGGALSQRGLQQLGFLIAGLACGVSLVAIWLLVREPLQPTDASGPLSATGKTPERRGGSTFRHAVAQMWETFRQPGVLAIGAFLLLRNFNPFSSTVLYYYSTAHLQFNDQFVGMLTSGHAAGVVLGSVVYGVVCRRVPVHWMIHGSIAAGILATMAYWGYRDATSGVVVSLAVGIAFAIGELTQLDLAARVCKPETAATTFALLMSLSNLSLSLAQGLGGSIYEIIAGWWGYASAFQSLVAVGALFTAACWLLVPLLNRAIRLQTSETKA